MNKLIYGRKEVLQALLDGIRKHNSRKDLKRIEEIDAALDEITSRRVSLSSIAAKGYIDSATFTQESNSLNAEAEELRREHGALIKCVSEIGNKTDAVRELLTFAGKQEMFSEFDAEVFRRFVDRMTLVSRTEVAFHLKCGLNLKEEVK